MKKYLLAPTVLLALSGTAIASPLTAGLPLVLAPAPITLRMQVRPVLAPLSIATPAFAPGYSVGNGYNLAYVRPASVIVDWHRPHPPELFFRR